MAWISPTAHLDPDGQWGNEVNAYDETLSSYAASVGYGLCYSGHKLELHLGSPISCSKVRIYNNAGTYFPTAIIDLYYDGAWHNIVTDGDISGYQQWTEFEIPAGTKTVSKARIDVCRASTSGTRNIYEFDFWEVEAAPAGRSFAFVIG